ncbi:hypothetical protein ON010_g16934 [Phytophthora cinnamomi]|nr:hypothetical protein ON010_g16934 [Phytophthora cinnamomi]
MKAEVDELALRNMTLVSSMIWEIVREGFTTSKMIRGLTCEQVISRVYRIRNLHFGSTIYGRVEVPLLSMTKDGDAAFFLFHYTLDGDVGTISCDFERGLIKAVGDQFPETDIVGCLFHFKQAVRRKMIKLRIPKEEVSGMMQRGYLDALTALPHDRIDPRLCHHKVKAASRQETTQVLRATQGGLIRGFPLLSLSRTSTSQPFLPAQMALRTIGDRAFVGPAHLTELTEFQYVELVSVNGSTATVKLDGPEVEENAAPLEMSVDTFRHRRVSENERQAWPGSIVTYPVAFARPSSDGVDEWSYGVASG